jgi:hypothetical protein
MLMQRVEQAGRRREQQRAVRMPVESCADHARGRLTQETEPLLSGSATVSHLTDGVIRFPLHWIMR